MATPATSKLKSIINSVSASILLAASYAIAGTNDVQISRIVSEGNNMYSIYVPTSQVGYTYSLWEAKSPPMSQTNVWTKTSTKPGNNSELIFGRVNTNRESYFKVSRQ